jgi:hypothetical protein
MPRRKQTTINLKELECYPTFLEELRNNPAYSDKDLTTLKLTVLDSYEATIKEVDKAIKHLQYYVAAKKSTIETFKDEQLISRVRLAKMLLKIELRITNNRHSFSVLSRIRFKKPDRKLHHFLYIIEIH